MEKPSIGLPADYQKSQRISTQFGHVLVVLMMTSLSIAFAFFGSRVLSDWNGAYLVVFGLLLALETIYTRSRIQALEFRERAIFRASEAVAFAIIAKLTLYLLNDPSQLLRDLPRWQTDFGGSFFSGDYLFTLIVFLTIWFFSMAYAGDLEALYNCEIDAVWDELGKLQNALHSIRRRIAGRIFVVGMLIVILSVLTRLDIDVVLRQRGTGFIYTATVVNVLFYFILALVLLSQSQLVLLRTRWLWQKLPMSGAVTSNWLKYGLISCLVLAILVAFLPTSYSIGLLDTIRLVFEYLIQIASVLMVILTLPFSLCMSLLSLFRQDGETIAQPQAQIQAMPPQSAGEPIGWIEFLRSLLFWALFIGVIFFALRYYLSQHANLWNAITRFPLIRMISQMFNDFFRWIKRANRRVSRFVQAGIKRMREPRTGTSALSVRRMRNFARMDPRERIIHFYLNLIQLGGEHGIQRRVNQTPNDYEHQLSSAAPEVNQDLHELTATFLEARYSQHPVDEPLSQYAGNLWERIKAILKNFKHEA